ncbi:MAG: YdcF family protein [Candidatus Omnitrophica bacterium]|nr:YdcF family protein [Candidatus Omnitrophota bacterium]MDD5670755.1 YdcF family protein [Candidatus Omnitrophota bacterium]
MKKIILFTTVFALIIVTVRWWIPYPGLFLVPQDEFGKADCIVILQGDNECRFPKAIELYEQGYAPRILLSPVQEKESLLRDYYNFENRIMGLPDMSSKERASKIFAYFGKDEKDVFYTDREVTSTFDEAAATRHWMLARGYRSFILVSSTYHMRRALMIFRFVFRGTGVRIDHATAANPLLNPARWWTKERDVKGVLMEYVSIVYNVFYHFILGKGITSFDTP